LRLTNPLIAYRDYFDLLRSVNVEEMGANLDSEEHKRSGDNVAMAVHSEVMSEDFNPSRRGRRPMIKIDPLLDAVHRAQGRWVKFEIDDSREANSVLRQLSKEEDVETSSESRDDGGKNVYARHMPGR
jgi:hypothetical protein